MNFNLTKEQEEEFNKIVKENKDKINLAMYKCNIRHKDYDEFYSFCLEGLLVSYLILKNNDIAEKDFQRFSYITMKRKIIDELRRRNRRKISYIEEIENTKIFSVKTKEIQEIEIRESLAKTFNKREIEIIKLLEKGKEKKEIFKDLNISKSKGYTIIADIKERYKNLLYNS